MIIELTNSFFFCHNSPKAFETFQHFEMFLASFMNNYLFERTIEKCATLIINVDFGVLNNERF